MPEAKFQIKRKCEVCGNTFIAKTLDSRYCCRHCTDIAEREVVISFLRSLQKMGIVEVKRKYRIIYIHILNLACIETEETENDSE